ncbi:transposon Tf2-6 polyprotein [Trichonephila clavipes]|uniref:Transposon Tf2-6 polyprotein n=1 Tax=Trichonephila clavipes TaxID=2585209 RepID=A0A8X6WEA3_TRICX|nr:transposon Tf2-6 polyprotein [Trichonephila clavipes]
MNRRAASHNVPKELMLELFLQQLPTAVQTILASITPTTVEKAAKSPTESSKKKRIQRGVNATTFSQPHISRRLFIKDKSSNTAFLIDTGSDVSVLPASLSEKRKGNSIQQLSAANTSPINVYVHSIKLVSGESIFHDVLREFPEIVKPPSFSQEVKHNIKHFIETSGPPVFAKARRLAPDRLKIAKSEFQHMLNLGHVRPSKSNYASPLHIVPKKDSNDWRPLHHHLKPSISNIFGLLFQRLDQYGLSINPSKCTFGVPTLNFLGFQVCSSGIKPLEDRVEAIFKFPKPTTITQLRRSLGMLNYYSVSLDRLPISLHL